VTYLPLPDGAPRVAYGVGRRVGPAVVRNRVRRRLRAAARELAGDPGLAPGAYLVTVSPRAVVASYADLRRQLGEACAAATAHAAPAASPTTGAAR
jgi:ribonuclease P protein component